MFNYEFPENYTPGVLLGMYNIDQLFISKIKSDLTSQCKNNINYLEITDTSLRKPKLKRIKESNYDELGMVSLNLIEKFQYIIPGLIIQMIDITDLIIDIQNIDINQVCEPIIKNIQLIKNSYPQSSQIIIIKNFKRITGLESNIKNTILKNSKLNLYEKSFYFINDALYLNNIGIIKQISKLINDEIIEFYKLKIQLYINKYQLQKNNELKEYAIKYLIKIYLLIKVSNVINDNQQKIYYDYLTNAYNTLIILNKKSYMFCFDNLKAKYLEIKNLADFLLNQILSNKSFDHKNLFDLVMKHLFIFDKKNIFIDNNNKTNNKTITEFNKYKDITFINMKWKFSWLKYLSGKINDINNNNNKLLNYFIFNNLFHIYIFLKKNPNFIQEINSTIVKDITTKKIKPKYLEKIPKLYEMDGENITGILSDEENLGFYISDLISDEQNLLNSENILKLIKEYFSNNQLNSYDFYLINKFCKDNEYKEDFNNVLVKIINTQSNNIFKFINVYQHISNKINKILLELKSKKEENEFFNNHFKILEYFINYASLSNKEFPKEIIDILNELLSRNMNIDSQKNIIKLDNLESKLFNIKINYSSKEVIFLDFIDVSIDISLLRKELMINIEKIIVYFSNYKNNKEENANNKKEIIIGKNLIADEPMNINFKYLINSYFNKLYITNIELYLNNKIIINIINKSKKDIIFYSKKYSQINIDDIINIDIYNTNKSNNQLLIGKDENHLLYIKYNLKYDNKDIYIKKVNIYIQLLEKDENINTNNHEIKIFEGIEGYNIGDNKQLLYEFENKNLDNDYPLVQYLLKVKEEGNFVLNYKFHFTLINKNCPDEICNLECNKTILIKSIEPFKFSNEIKSSIYFINPKDKIKTYPMNKPINIISYFKNELSSNLIIKNIIHIPNNDSLEINSTTEKLFSKINNFNLKFSRNEIISINAKIKSNRDISSSIGKLKIFWVSEELFNNKYFSESYLNCSIFDLININIKAMPLIIEGKYLKMYNKYEIGIKNMEHISKIFDMNIKEENSDEKYILCGKTNINGLLTPNKEIKILLNVYDSATGNNIDENKENKVFKFNNIITVNEYYVLGEKNKFKSLKNVIYFSPELFKLPN